MTAIRVTEDSTAPELCEAITHLRAKQCRCVDAEARDEIATVIDELLERLPH